jgi:outer membrane protein TolC
MKLARMLFVCVLAVNGTVIAQEPVLPTPTTGPVTPTALEPEVAFPTPTPDLTEVKLLDEVPNYAEILVHQWSSGVPGSEIDIGAATQYYGRLIDVGPGRPITLQESIALALQNNTTLRIARLNPLSAQAEVRRARSVFDPQLFGNVSKSREVDPVGTISQFTSTSLSTFNQNFNATAGARKTLLSGGQLSLQWTNDRIKNNPTIVNQLVPSYVTTLGLSLNQPLLRDFGWRYSLLLVDIAELGQEQAYYQYRAGISDLVNRVVKAYWDFVQAIENVRVEDQGLGFAREVLRQNEGRFNVGALPKTAVLEAQAEVARREALLVRARNERKIAQDNLRAIINYRPKDSAAILMVEPEDAPTVVPYEVDLDRSLKTALERRPEIEAARLDVKGKQLQRKVAENQLLPRLDFAGSIGLNGLGGNDAGIPVPTPAPGSPLTGFQPNPSALGGYSKSLDLLTNGDFYQYSAGAQIEIPIANAQAKADYALAKVNSQRSFLSLQELEENVTLQVKQAVTNLISVREGIDAVRLARETAEENLRNQKARYDVGLATTKDLLDYQDRLTQAKAAEVLTLTGYNTALAELRRAEGTLLDSLNIVVEQSKPEQPPWWARF